MLHVAHKKGKLSCKSKLHILLMDLLITSEINLKNYSIHLIPCSWDYIFYEKFKIQFVIFLNKWVNWNKKCNLTAHKVFNS